MIRKKTWFKWKFSQTTCVIIRKTCGTRVFFSDKMSPYRWINVPLEELSKTTCLLIRGSYFVWMIFSDSVASSLARCSTEKLFETNCLLISGSLTTWMLLWDALVALFRFNSVDLVGNFLFKKLKNGYRDWLTTFLRSFCWNFFFVFFSGYQRNHFNPQSLQLQLTLSFLVIIHAFPFGSREPAFFQVFTGSF